jgi:hypothetical protein
LLPFLLRRRDNIGLFFIFVRRRGLWCFGLDFGLGFDGRGMAIRLRIWCRGGREGSGGVRGAVEALHY